MFSSNLWMIVAKLELLAPLFLELCLLTTIRDSYAWLVFAKQRYAYLSKWVCGYLLLCVCLQRGNAIRIWMISRVVIKLVMSSEGPWFMSNDASAWLVVWVALWNVVNWLKFEDAIVLVLPNSLLDRSLLPSKSWSWEPRWLPSKSCSSFWSGNQTMKGIDNLKFCTECLPLLMVSITTSGSIHFPHFGVGTPFLKSVHINK